jgi:hypothetical protein
MPVTGVKIDDAKLRRRLGRILAHKFIDEVEAELRNAAPKWVQDIRNRISQPFTFEQATGAVPRKRSGRLGRAIEAVVKRRTKADVNAQVGVLNPAKAPYASVQERGGVMRAKSKLLTVPLPAALNSKGVQKFTARTARRHFSSTYVANKVIYGMRGKTRVPLFVLKKYVRLRKRPFVKPQAKVIRLELIGIVKRAANKAARGA